MGTKQLFEKHGVPIEGEDSPKILWWGGFERAAAEITAAAEADKAELLVQIEEMRGALEWLVNLLHEQSKGGDATSPPSDDEWKAAIDAGVKALAPVPKRVLWRAEGTVARDYDLERTYVFVGDHRLRIDNGPEHGQVGTVAFLTEPEQSGEE